MKIGGLTFHASYNFGSNLQSYALQQYINKLSNEYNANIDYSIINLRTDIQERMNDYKLDCNFLKRVFKQVFFGSKLNQRAKNFEFFINNKLNVTKEFKTRQQIIDDDVMYDVCITGSDQIWNLMAYDFDWSYFLDGIKCKKKVSYAVSSGPKAREIADNDKKRIAELLQSYDHISVREEGTKKFISQFTDKEININMDPTLLLDKEDWNKIIKPERIIEEPYILYYSLRPTKERTLYLKEISKKLNMKIVVANPSYKYDIMGGFMRKYDSGPMEFLNLLKNASLVISSSFHGTIFSVILNVPFYALNGKNDYRISTLLKTMQLEDRMIMEGDNVDDIEKNAFSINFNNVNKMIESEREKSKQYLITALGIGEFNGGNM